MCEDWLIKRETCVEAELQSNGLILIVLIWLL
jgi:hypothetical protein